MEKFAFQPYVPTVRVPSDGDIGRRLAVRAQRDDAERTIIDLEFAQCRRDRAELAKPALLAKMLDLSADVWGSRWTDGLEFLLWEAASSPQPRRLVILRSDAARLLQLATWADGWWVWDDTLPPDVVDCERFVGLDEWRRMYQEKTS